VEGETPLPAAFLARNSHQPLQLTEVQSLKERLVKARAVPRKGFDQLRKQLSRLLVSQLENMSKGIHNRIHAAQPIEISLPVSAPALRHQLLFGAGEGGCEGGDDPTSAGA
jgi:hypothetical protein